MSALAKKNKRYGLDLTEGSVQKVLLRFAWPFLVSGIITAMYGAVDMFVISRYMQGEVISGVATGTMVIQIVYTFIIAISTGGTVLIGRKIGEKDDEGCAKGAGTLMTLGLFLGLLLTGLIFVALEPILKLMRTPVDALPHARIYVRLAATGIPFTVGFNIISAIARGFGNSTVPSIIGVIGAILHIILDLLFVAVLGMEEDGVAIATAISQMTTLIIIGIWILKKRFPFAFHKHHFKPHGKSLVSIIKVAIPLWLQEILIHISFMVIMTIINDMGVVASASVGLINRVFSLGAVIPSAVGSAIAAITAQNIGANKRARALKSLKFGIIYCLIVEGLLVIWAQIAPEMITSFFAEGKQEVVIGAAAHLRSFSLDLLLVPIIFCFNAYLNACGKANFTMIHSLFGTFVVRVPFSFLFARIGNDVNHSLFLLGLTSPMATLASLCICVPFMIWFERKQKQKDLERLNERQ